MKTLINLLSEKHPELITIENDAAKSFHTESLVATKIFPKLQAKIASIRFFIFINNRWLT